MSRDKYTLTIDGIPRVFTEEQIVAAIKTCADIEYCKRHKGERLLNEEYFKILELRKTIEKMKVEQENLIAERDHLKQRIEELKEESKDTVKKEVYKEKTRPINLNSSIKVKLTPKGADIFYHQHDELIKKFGCKRAASMPAIDEDGYTRFLLWDFMRIYGKYMDITAEYVIDPFEIIFED